MSIGDPWDLDVGGRDLTNVPHPSPQVAVAHLFPGDRPQGTVTLFTPWRRDKSMDAFPTPETSPDLGAVVVRFTPVGSYVTKARWLAIALLVMSTAGWILAARAAFLRQEPLLLLGLVAGGLVFAGLGEMIRRQVAAVQGLEIRIHDQGLAIDRPRSAFAFHWHDVEYLWLNSWAHTDKPGGGLTIRVRLDGGTEHRLKLESFQMADLGSLEHHLASRVAEARLADLRPRFDKGKWIAFGPLEISTDGVRASSNQIEWADLGSVTVEDGRLLLRREPRGMAWRVQPLRDVPNAQALVDLIRPYRTDVAQ